MQTVSIETAPAGVRIDKGLDIKNFANWKRPKHPYDFSFFNRLGVGDSFVINSGDFCRATNWSKPYPSIDSIRQRMYTEMSDRGWKYASRKVAGTEDTRIWRLS